jgi:hypothetical protein
MASRADFCARTLRPWLGNLALIDVGPDKRATFRLCGTNLIDRFGGEFTNRRVAELSDADRSSVETYIQCVCGSRTPKEGAHACVIDGTLERFREHCLPLSDTDEGVSTLLFASFPMGIKET